MDRTKAAAIVNDFFADMNPSLWNGSTSMPKSFDDRAWQYFVQNLKLLAIISFILLMMKQ